MAGVFLSLLLSGVLRCSLNVHAVIVPVFLKVGTQGLARPESQLDPRRGLVQILAEFRRYRQKLSISRQISQFLAISTGHKAHP